jgi:2-methylfumaryl-CoA isomerase
MGILSGLRIVECGAFIAGPFATLSLAKLGAEVIRIDPIGGSIDQQRWPVTAQGRSLYWAGLNKGKKSVAIDLTRPEGQALAQRIITAPGADTGLLVTNLPAIGWLAWEKLAALRPDLIMVSIVGNRDGSTALDYTVNCATGFPGVTGPADGEGPVNHVLPAWDFICGQSAATALLAAERHRRLTGEGQKVRIALSDVALAIVGDLGLVAEVELNGGERGRHGNHIYGAFGRDFETSDGRRLMVAAVSLAQWKALVRACGLAGFVAGLEAAQGIDLGRDGDRFAAREAIAAELVPWFAARTLSEAAAALDAARVCWGPYQSFAQLVAEDGRLSPKAGLFAPVDHPGIGETLTPGSPAIFSAAEAVPGAPAPLPGEDGGAVLRDVLGLDATSIARLRDERLIA